MGFSDQQRRSLTSKLHKRHIRTRTSGDTLLSFVSAWHVIAEANRIFGHDAWDRQTSSPTCLWTDRRQGQFAVMYLAKVRVTVRAGPILITREGIGTGYGRSPHEEAAHEIAIKAAETDATKRALATFGNPFGLSLYESGKRRPQETAPTAPALPKVDLTLDLGEGRRLSFDTKEELASGFQKCICDLDTLRDVYAFWERNLQSLVILSDEAKDRNPVPAILDALKDRARVVAKMGQEPTHTAAPTAPPRDVSGGQDRGARLLQGSNRATPLLKERRIRDKNHLRFVARHPCIICGRSPAQAHHVRFAQPRAMAMKVSDEFTVPLCAIHHDDVHRTGDERAWWARHVVDPLKIAEELWRTPDKSEASDLNEYASDRTRAMARGSVPEHGVPNREEEGARSSAVSKRPMASGPVEEPQSDPATKDGPDRRNPGQIPTSPAGE